MVCLNWNDAEAYVDWLAAKTGKPYRLLSAAKWEYAGKSARLPADSATSTEAFAVCFVAI